MKYSILGLLLLGICHSAFSVDYLNEWDGELDFSCPDGEHISNLYSTHSNSKEDRRWAISCRNSKYVKTGNDCSWTVNYENDWDKVLDYTCPDNGIITGLRSIHSNSKEDRRWKIRCCKLAVSEGTNCYTRSDYINEWDKVMNYPVPDGQAIVGLYSYHSNSKEDRRWKPKLCHFTFCHATKMTILDAITPSYTGKKVIGIITEQGCSSATHTPFISQSASLTTTESYTTTQSSEYSFGTTLSVEYEVSAELFGVGFSSSYGVSVSAGGSVGVEESKTEEVSIGNAVNSGTNAAYTGPGAVLIMAYKDEYQFNTNNVNVEYDIFCDNNSSYKKRGTVNLTAKSYGKTYVVKRVAVFHNKSDCTTATEDCVAAIQGELALTPDAITANFAACFPNGIATVAKK